MKKMLLVLLCFSCASPHDIIDSRFYTRAYYDETLMENVNIYLEMAKERGIDISEMNDLYRVEYTKLPSKINARCTTYTMPASGKQYKVLTVRNDVHFGKYQTLVLVMHELGHCIHNLKHSQVPNSIMYAYNPMDEEVYNQYWDYFVNQYFDYLQNGDPKGTEKLDIGDE